VRCTIGVAIPLVLGVMLGGPLSGVSAAIGALCAGIASRQGVYRTRAASMLLTSAAMALSAFVGCVTDTTPVANVLVTGLWGVGAGIIAAIGPTATAIGINAVIALVVFSHAPYDASEALPQAALVFAGGALQTVLLVLIWPLQRFSAERRVLAAAYRALGAYAGSFPRAKLGAPASASLETVSDTLADPQPFARRGEIAAYEALLDGAQRIRASLAALATDRHLLETHGADEAVHAIDELGSLAELVLSEIAAALEHARVPNRLDALWHALDLQAAALERGHVALEGKPAQSDVDQAVQDSRAFLGQLRTAWRSGQATGGHGAASALRPRERQPFALTLLGEALETLRANLALNSAFGQHAIRLGTTLLLGALAERALGLERGYWIPLTAVLVLRPDFTTTITRGGARVAGTVAGALIAGAITGWVHPGPAAYMILAIAAIGIGLVIFNVNYGIYTITLTVYVVFLLALGGSPEHNAALDRVGATLIGGAMALAIYVLWPTWSRERVPAELADLLDAQRRYGTLVLRAYLAPQAAVEREIRDAQLASWLARSNATASVDQMIAEPVRPRAITVRAALGILAASRRYGIAILTLFARLERGAAIAQNTLETLTAQLDTSMCMLAEALRENHTPDALPRLRDAQVELKRAFDQTGDASLGALVSETDLLVDSVETIAEIIAHLHETSLTL